LTGFATGTLSSANVNFSDIEMLVGNEGTDAFIFQNANAVTIAIDGGGGRDRLDHSALAQVNIQVQEFGSFGTQDGFDGAGTGLVGRFFNIERADGSLIGQNDNIGGPDENVTWDANDGLSSLTSASGSFVFNDFESLRGGSQTDSFFVEARHDTPMRFIGGTGDDDLRVDLARQPTLDHLIVWEPRCDSAQDLIPKQVVLRVWELVTT